MNYPKVSVVIATNKQRAATYEESLKIQDYPNYEVIRIEGYTAAKARNMGIKKAEGEIIVFIDDDVILPAGWISKGVNILKESRVDILGGPNLVLPTASIGEKISDFLVSTGILNGFRKKFKKSRQSGFSEYTDFATCNLMMYKSVFDKIEYFNERYRYTEDMEFLLRCKIRGFSLYYSPDLFLYHRRRTFPFKHMRQVFFWGYGNMQLALHYPFIFKRPDIWGSLILFPIFFILLSLYFKAVIIIGIILAPITIHFFSYSLGILAGLITFFLRSNR